MQIEIRAASIKDAAAICKLNKSEMGYDFSLEDTEKKLCQLLNNGSNRILVAVAYKEVVGYVHANDYDLLYAPPMKNIMGIAVYSVWQKQGIGSMLLDEIERWACETDAVAIRLVSGESRSKAHAFYEACGYIYGKKQLNFKKELT